MALIFQRLARNFIKNGYFPTDEVTIARTLSMLDAKESSELQILDPCCGEGIALAECGHHLKAMAKSVKTAAIEFNRERALHSKSLLDHVVHADIQDCVMAQQQFGLLWLNPPYADRVTDQSLDAKGSKGRDRMEKYFLSRTMPALQYGGVLVYIIPHYILDRYLAKTLAISLKELSIYRLPEDRFKQVVVLGYRQRQVPVGKAEKAIIDHLLKVREDRNAAPELPEIPDREYQVPASRPQALQRGLDVRSVTLTAEAIDEVKAKHSGLWPDFSQHFNQSAAIRRRPARALSKWHLALLLAAGQVSGVVRSPDGRSLLVKGGTHKEKETVMEFKETKDGVEETRIAIDRFVPIIRAIDVTEDRETFGDVLTIR